MRVAVIVPTYNRHQLLRYTLDYLSAQDIALPIEMEIVVVDDGSTDGTHELVDNYKTRIGNLLYKFCPRPLSGQSCPARVRNLGIEGSSSDILMFLDCGVLIPPSFIQRVVAWYNRFPNAVLIHYTLGLFTQPDMESMREINDLSPYNLSDKAELLSQDPKWLDIRQGMFDASCNELDTLPAPWTLAWSCAMSAPRHLVNEIGGFDESLQGWGSEDTDLGYRLYQHGASFVTTQDCIALHLPHPRTSSEAQKASNFVNRKMLHKKAYKFDTELYPYYPGLYYNQVLARFNQLALLDVLPRYSIAALEFISLKHLQPSALSLLIGVDNQVIARHLQTTHIFVHNLATLNRFQHSFGDRCIQWMLGCDTPYEDGYFDVVIVTDIIRLLPSTVQRDMVREMHRISQDVIYVCNWSYISPIHDADDGPWSSLEDLITLWDLLQLQTTPAEMVEQLSIIKVRK